MTFQIKLDFTALQNVRGAPSGRQRSSDGDGAGACRRVCAPTAHDDVVSRPRIQRDGRCDARVAVAARAVIIARNQALGRAARRGHDNLGVEVGLVQQKVVGC